MSGEMSMILFRIHHIWFIWLVQ